jgi:hypothetical protein
MFLFALQLLVPALSLSPRLCDVMQFGSEGEEQVWQVEDTEHEVSDK